MDLLKTSTLLFTLFFLTTVQAQDKSNIEHVIDSEVYGKDRKVRVYLPDRYHEQPDDTFIVTYFLDAQSDSFWDMAKGNVGYMVRSYMVIPMIAVGIVSDNRGSEFDPPATELQQHLEKEVFPLIKENYRVDDFKTIVGHSWGGAFVGSTLFSDQQDLFDAYIGISPSFGDTDNIIVKNAAKMLQDKATFNKYLYFSHGDVGRRELEFGGYVASIDSLLRKYPNKTITWKPELIAGTDHWQVVIPSVNSGLISMSRNYFADQKVFEDFAKDSGTTLKEQLQKFNRERRDQYNYVFEPSGGYLNFVANDFRDKDQYATALEVYQLALQKDPKNVKIFVNISDTYDKLGNKTEAKKSFTETLSMLEAQKEDLSENYYKNVSKWVKEKLEELK